MVISLTLQYRTATRVHCTIRDIGIRVVNTVLLQQDTTVESAIYDPVMMIARNRKAVLSTLKADRVGSKWVLKISASTNPQRSFIL